MIAAPPVAVFLPQSAPFASKPIAQCFPKLVPAIEGKMLEAFHDSPRRRCGIFFVLRSGRPFFDRIGMFADGTIHGLLSGRAELRLFGSRTHLGLLDSRTWLCLLGDGIGLG